MNEKITEKEEKVTGMRKDDNMLGQGSVAEVKDMLLLVGERNNYTVFQERCTLDPEVVRGE